MCGFTAVPESKVSMGLSNQMSCWEHEGHLLGSNTERATLWPFSTSPIYTFGTVHIRCTWIIRSGVSHGWLLLQTSEMIVSCINEHVCVGCVCYMWENILLSRHVGSVLLIVDTKQPQGEGTDTYIWLGTISVTENRLLGTFNGTRRQQSDKRDIFLLSSVQWEWPQQTRVRLSATLVKHDKGKGPAAAALTAPSKHRKKATKMELFPQVTCVSCLLLLSFSVRELSCALILSLALCSSLAESTASSFARRSTSMWRCWDSIRCCREEEEEERCGAFISILFLLHLLFAPFVPCSQDSCCSWSNRKKYTQ